MDIEVTTYENGKWTTEIVTLGGEAAAAAAEFVEAASSVEWCDCPEPDLEYYEYGGSHGWTCAACGGLVQTG